MSSKEAGTDTKNETGTEPNKDLDYESIRSEIGFVPQSLDNIFGQIYSEQRISMSGGYIHSNVGIEDKMGDSD